MGHFAELDGYTVGFETYTDDSDPSSLFKGLPDDHCQCPHWGVVVKGKLTHRYSDATEETITEGEAYYARPGHLPFLHAGTEVIEFSPTTELQHNGGHREEHGLGQFLIWSLIVQRHRCGTIGARFRPGFAASQM